MIRKINFEVNENLIKSDLKNDIIPREYLDNGDIVIAEFEFSSDWDNAVKVVRFSKGDTEYDPQILEHGVTCVIPKEALDGGFFRIAVLGKNRIGTYLRTYSKLITVWGRDKSKWIKQKNY